LTSLVPLIAITVYLMGVEQAYLMNQPKAQAEMNVRRQAGAAKESCSTIL